MDAATIAVNIFSNFTRVARPAPPPSVTPNRVLPERADFTPLAADSTITGSGALMVSLLKRVYDIPDPNSVAEFLDNHLALAHLLVDARRQILQYFPHSSVALEVFIDPEF